MSTERTPLLNAQHPSGQGADHTLSPQVILPTHEKMEEAYAGWRFYVLFAALWTTTFVMSLDGTLCAVIISEIGSSFSANEIASWLGTSYLLSVAMATPIYGRLCDPDLLGRRGTVLTALGLFGIGTIACGFAPSMNTLIAARILAGAGGGGVAVSTSVVVSDVIPIKQRGLFQGYTNILFGLGAGVGGPLGGWISDNFGWRAAFTVQIPFLLVGFLTLALMIREPPPPPAEAGKPSIIVTRKQKLLKIDYLGCLTLVGTLGTLLVGLSLKTTEELAWSHPHVWGLLVASGVFCVAFVFWEVYGARDNAILPMSILSARTPAAVALNNFLAAIVSFSILYNVPMYFNAVLLRSNSNSGAHLIPNSIALAIGSVFAGWYMRHTGKYWSLTIICCSMIVLANVGLSLWTPSTSEFLFYATIVPAGFGFSVCLTTTLIALISSVERKHIPIATGISYSARTSGQVLGVSLTATLTQSLLDKELKKRITGEGAAEIIANIRHSVPYIHTLPEALKEAATSSWGSALRAVFIVQVAGAILLLLTVIPIEENNLPDTTTEESKPVSRVASSTTVVEDQA